MNLIAWSLSFSLLVVMMGQAVQFHRATVCRQEAWLKSTELATRELLYNQPSQETNWHLSCKLRIYRNLKDITWQKVPGLKKHKFILNLTGKI